ncbi:hypothetical protein TNCV_1596911 [Trichonephila clavipes]|nr:hypothetical protein TNCV_1596911 [Trichonephila clavipes]
MSSKIPTLLISSAKIQAHLLLSTSATVTSSSESQPHIHLMDTAPATASAASSFSSNKALSSFTLSMFALLLACPVLETAYTTPNTIDFKFQAAKQTSKTRRKRRPSRSITPKKHK